MSGRILKISLRFQRAQRRLLRPGTPSAQGLAATIARLQLGDLPGPLDAETLVPPVARWWFRRVAGANLWVLFTFDSSCVTLRSLANNPPISSRPTRRTRSMTTGSSVTSSASTTGSRCRYGISLSASTKAVNSTIAPILSSSWNSATRAG